VAVLGQIFGDSVETSACSHVAMNQNSGRPFTLPINVVGGIGFIV